MIRPPKPMIGTGALEKWCNQLLRFVECSQVIGSPTARIEESPRGRSVFANGGSAGASTPAGPIVPFVLIQQFQNYVIGQSQITGESIQVAKPPKHRNNISQETIDNVAWAITYPQNAPTGSPPVLSPLAFVTRTKSNGGYSEKQRITPAWQIGNVFYAVSISPNAGVSSEAGDTLSAVGTPIKYLDLNVDGRAWSATPDGNT